MALAINKYFLEAKKRNIEPYQIGYSTATETNVEIHNGEVEVQEIGTTQDISARGIYNGKQGAFSTDSIDKETPSLLAEKVFENSTYGKKISADTYFKGGLKYKKLDTKSKDFKKSTLKDLREFGLVIYKEVKALDDRLTNVTVDVMMQDSLSQKFNSYGVRCKNESSNYICSISIVAVDKDGEPRSGSISCSSFLSLDELKENVQKKYSELLSSAIDFFKSKPLDTDKYKVLLHRNCARSLLAYFISQLNAKDVQKNLSVFKGKKGKQIASSCLTIKNIPHLTSFSASSYDADGYPTQEFTFIENGILKDYFYSVETANKEHRESNGCASGNGNGAAINIYVEPGNDDLESLYQKIGDGLYITSISGLNSGINGQTLDFSLPCEGYLIKDGKKDKAFSMMIVAGNLLDVFNHVTYLANDVSIKDRKFNPSMVIDSLTVSGK